MSICGCRRATCSLITWVCFLCYTRIATFLWPPCVADADIIFSSCSLFFFLVFFHRLISAVADWISTILHTWCGLSANLGCRSETCHVLHVARSKYRTQKSPKIRHLRIIAQLSRAISLQLRHISTIGKKLLNSNISSTCPHNMAISNFGPLMAEISMFGAPQQISMGFASWQRYCTAL